MNPNTTQFPNLSRLHLSTFHLVFPCLPIFNLFFLKYTAIIVRNEVQRFGTYKMFGLGSFDLIE